MADVRDINLRTLKRIDPTIGAITESTSQSALYTYDPEAERWTKSECEGCLHLFKRTSYCNRNDNLKPGFESGFGFVILDKATMAHHIEDIKLGAIVESLDEAGHNLVMFTSISGSVCCFWFPTNEDAEKIHLAMRSCCGNMR